MVGTVTPSPRQSLWRRAAPHVFGLALVEWALSFALARRIVTAFALPLEAHPAGGDAVLSEDGRVALELYFARSAELPPALAAVALYALLALLVTAPLHGALPSLARGLPRNPWAQSISKTPTLIALAIAQCTLVALFLLAVRGPVSSTAIDALSRATPLAIGSFAALLAVIWAILGALRVLFALARGAAVGGQTTRAALTHALATLRRRPIRLVLSRLVLDVAGLALAALATVAPAAAAVGASLVTHVGHVSLELAWLDRALDGLPTPAPTD
jgi:hypothetical protein